MKRKFALLGFPFLLGLLAFSVDWGKYAPIFIPVALSFLFISLIIFKCYTVYILISALMFITGIMYSSIYTLTVYQEVIAYDGKSVTIKGYVQDISYIGRDTDKITVNGKINDRTNAVIILTADHVDLDYYDKVTVRCKAEKIADSIDLESEKYFRPKGIFLYSNDTEYITKTGNSRYLMREIKHFRDRILKDIQNNVGGDEGGFICAMLCGDKTDLSYSAKQKLYRTGIGHIFSVSGTHLVIISSVFNALFGMFPTRKRTKFILMQFVIWSFAIFAGMSPSIIRSAIMMTLVLGSDVFRRHGDCLNALGLCCIILTVGDPYTVRDPSFMLSMSGAFALGVAAPHINGMIEHKGFMGGVLKNLSTMFILMFTVMPVSLMFFNEISLTAPISNMILIPLCTAALTTAFASALLLPFGIISVPLMKTAGLIIKPVLYISNIISSIPYSYITISKTHSKVIFSAMAILAIGFIILLRSNRGRILCVTIFYAVFIVTFNLSAATDTDCLHIVVIPYKNGSQALLYKNREGVVIDSSAKGKHNSALCRLCEKRDVAAVDAVMIFDQYPYTSAQYDAELFPEPKKIIGESLYNEDDGIHINGKEYSFKDAEICMNEYGHTISYKDHYIEIVGKNTFVDGTKQNGYQKLYELIFRDGKYELKELDYAFDEQ